MGEYVSNARKRCPAMIEARIEDPESYEGKHFCWQECPYPKCVVYEAGQHYNAMRRDERAIKAKALIAEGHSIEAIAQMLRVSTRSVQRYLTK